MRRYTLTILVIITMIQTLPCSRNQLPIVKDKNKRLKLTCLSAISAAAPVGIIEEGLAGARDDEVKYSMGM